MKKPVPPRKAVARMSAFHGIRENRAGFLRLDFNENTMGCSPAARRAIRSMTQEQIATYPEYEATRARLARHFRVHPSELVLTNGADDALRMLFDVFMDRGEKVLLVEPTFNMYRFWANLAASRIVELRYDSKMRFPHSEVLQTLRRERPRAFVLANPNNPTGTLIGKSALQKILDAAPRTIVMVDEAYSEFSGVTVLPWIRRFPNLVVVRTLSKGTGLAALRLGCLFANAQTALEFRKAQAPFAVNAVALLAAEAAVTDTGYTRRVVAEILRSKKELETGLQKLGVRVFPSGGNFLLADVGVQAPHIIRGLEKRRILVRDRSYDFGKPGCIRITVGTRPQMRRLLKALFELL
ncbi:MAG: histidinol-phosphate transaminase, partial [Acidobacteria bacterium]|nr:histidinol-phosphate transaminase [Acidobacteriota bacterium]